MSACKTRFDLPVLALSLPYLLFAVDIKCNYLRCLVKILPMLFMVASVALQYRKTSFGSKRKYLFKILLGLIASTAGDAFLVFTKVSSNYLLLGTVSFGIAHIFYIAAYGLKPFKPSGALIVLGLQLLALTIFYKPLVQMGQIFLIVIPTYMLILLTVAWRGLVRSKLDSKGLQLAKFNINYCKLSGISFVISDSILGLTEVTGLIGPHQLSPFMSSLLIHITYYFSQYCFAKTAL